MVGRYHVETYTSGGHKYYRLARSYRDENGRPRKERLVHLGKAKTPEEALAAIEVKVQRLYESKHYDRLVEAESDVKRLEAEIKEIWGAALEYWHGGEVPSVEDAMYLRRVGRRRQKVTDPRRDVHWGYNVTWLPRPEHRLHVTPNIIENREPLHYEYKNYADDFEVDETEEYTSMRFWDFIASLRDLERARAAAAEARAVFEEKKHKLEKRMHELELYVGL
jgi:ribosomal protein L32E